MAVMEARTGHVVTWQPEDGGPATIRTASGATYTVDGRRRIRGGSLALARAFVCGAVTVGLRMEIVTDAGLVYSSVVTDILPDAGAEEERPWHSPA